MVFNYNANINCKHNKKDVSHGKAFMSGFILN